MVGCELSCNRIDREYGPLYLGRCRGGLVGGSSRRPGPPYGLFVWPNRRRCSQGRGWNRRLFSALQTRCLRHRCVNCGVHSRCHLCELDHPSFTGNVEVTRRAVRCSSLVLRLGRRWCNFPCEYCPPLWPNASERRGGDLYGGG